MCQCESAERFGDLAVHLIAPRGGDRLRSRICPQAGDHSIGDLARAEPGSHSGGEWGNGRRVKGRLNVPAEGVERPLAQFVRAALALGSGSCSVSSQPAPLRHWSQPLSTRTTTPR